MGKRSAKRLDGGGRKVRSTTLDDNLMQWFDGHRKNGNAISGRQLQMQARRIATETTFKASDGWLHSFKKRHTLSTRVRTSIGQKLPPDYEEKIAQFHRFVIQLRQQHNYPLSDVYNMDETPLRFDMPGNRTLEHEGIKTVHIKTTNSEKRGFTAVLTVTADGQKIRPLIIFKGKRRLDDLTRREITVEVQEKGYINESLCLPWIRNTFPRRNDDSRRLLIWDSCSVHLTPAVKEELYSRNVDIAVIPGGLTSLLQPLDVGVNKPLKDYMHAEWDEWMKTGEALFTPAGKRKAPAKKTVLGWVVSSWNKVPPQTVINSFKKTGISNALDGSEDNLVYEDLEADDEAIGEEIAEIFYSDNEDDDEFFGF
uniref:Pogo transposable element with KRAB domain-like n=1 Tax=Saccoglossus kowalevskii TaxID=10224 RepID=A0ABM0GIL0_SACKO|nr:PREDICTED: pogo transposable element with KRAB domain-like [Saccoglossus kowalevskii]